MTIESQTADGSIIKDEDFTAVAVANGRLFLADGDRALRLQASFDAGTAEIVLAATEVVFFDESGNATDTLRFDAGLIQKFEMVLGGGNDFVPVLRQGVL